MDFRELEPIVSRQNPGLKEATAVLSEKFAKKAGLMLLEGQRLLSLALPSGGLLRLYFRDDREGERCFEALKGIPGFSLDKSRRLPARLFEELTQTVQSQGVIGLFQAPEIQPLRHVFPPRSRVLVLEEIQDPGNLGNLSRSVEAMGFHDLLFIGSHVRPWNAKSLRASMGSALYLRYCKADSLSAALPFFQNLDLITADMGGEQLSSFRGGSAERGFALLLGNEARGVSREARELCRYLVSVDMQGEAESLNLGSAAAILGWELSRLYAYFR